MKKLLTFILTAILLLPEIFASDFSVEQIMAKYDENDDFETSAMKAVLFVTDKFGTTKTTFGKEFITNISYCSFIKSIITNILI